MYNDYYLQSIDNKMTANNTLLNNIITNQTTVINNQFSIINNQSIIINSFQICFVWVIILLFADLFYHFFHEIFNGVR